MTTRALMLQFEEVVSAIPQQIASSMPHWRPEELETVVQTFEREYDHVMFFARTVLSSMYVSWLSPPSIDRLLRRLASHTHIVIDASPHGHAIACDRAQSRSANECTALFRELARWLRRDTGRFWLEHRPALHKVLQRLLVSLGSASNSRSAFGLRSGLLDPLFSAATCDNDELAQVRHLSVVSAACSSPQSCHRLTATCACVWEQLAAEIVADAFATASSEDLEHERLVEAIYYAAHRLLLTNAAFTQPTSGAADTDATVCRGLSRIACALAINHTAILFSPAMNEQRKIATSTCTSAAAAPSSDASFSSLFLEYLLRCSAHRDVDVVEPTLEFWFFFLDKSTQSGSLWHLLASVAEQEHVLGLLHQLVNALIGHCRYPTWLIETQQLTSDDVEIEGIVRIRKYVRLCCEESSSALATCSASHLRSRCP